MIATDRAQVSDHGAWRYHLQASVGNTEAARELDRDDDQERLDE
jgi:hypothetical protein